jgi:hypothetical protein
MKKHQVLASTPKRVWKTWFKLKLGTGLKTADDFRRAIKKQQRAEIDKWAVWIVGRHVASSLVGPDSIGLFKRLSKKINERVDALLGSSDFRVSPNEVEVELINVSVAELGFKNGANYKRICSRAKKLGLGLCPAEVGPQLYFQYVDQPLGEVLFIGMNSIMGNEEDGPGIFGVDRYRTGRNLFVTPGCHPACVLEGCRRLLFVRCG